MKRKLFIATSNIFIRRGGGLASLSYYNALSIIYNNYIDIAMPEEFVPFNTKNDVKIISVPERSNFVVAKEFIKGNVNRYRNCILTYLKEHLGDYDLVFINGGFYSGNLVKDIKKMGINVITIHHNFECQYHMDNKTIYTFFGKFPFLIKKYEKLSFKYSSLNLFLTKQDIDLLVKYYGDINPKRYYIGCFENSDNKLPVISNRDKIDYDFSISGSLNSFQTKSGILDFYNNYLDIAKQEIPDLKILITGREPSNEILQIQKNKPNTITIIKNPDDIFSLVENSLIYLCPTNIGGGIKLRIMDGLKMGLPILTHEVSSRGYDDFFNKPYFKKYNDKQSFKDSLNELLNFIHSTDNFKEMIRNDYSDYFSFQVGVNRIRTILEEDAFL